MCIYSVDWQKLRVFWYLLCVHERDIDVDRIYIAEDVLVPEDRDINLTVTVTGRGS